MARKRRLRKLSLRFLNPENEKAKIWNLKGPYIGIVGTELQIQTVHTALNLYDELLEIVRDYLDARTDHEREGLKERMEKAWRQANYQNLDGSIPTKTKNP